MECTLKVSEQFKQIRSELQVANHRIFNDMVARMMRAIETDVPGLRLRLSGKNSDNNTISAIVSGEVEDPEGEKRKQIDAAIEKFKNSNLGL